MIFFLYAYCLIIHDRINTFTFLWKNKILYNSLFSGDNSFITTFNVLSRKKKFWYKLKYLYFQFHIKQRSLRTTYFSPSTIYLFKIAGITDWPSRIYKMLCDTGKSIFFLTPWVYIHIIILYSVSDIYVNW